MKIFKPFRKVLLTPVKYTPSGRVYKVKGLNVYYLEEDSYSKHMYTLKGGINGVKNKIVSKKDIMILPNKKHTRYDKYFDKYSKQYPKLTKKQISKIADKGYKKTHSKKHARWSAVMYPDSVITVKN